MGRRVQYARNYLELFDLFERNGIDVWETMSDIENAVYDAGIEHPGYEYGVSTPKLVRALRNADMDGQDRMYAVTVLERDLREQTGEPMPEESEGRTYKMALKVTADEIAVVQRALADKRSGYLAPERYRPASGFAGSVVGGESEPLQKLTVAQFVQARLQALAEDGRIEVGVAGVLRGGLAFFERREIRQELDRLSEQIHVNDGEYTVAPALGRPWFWTIVSPVTSGN